MREDLIRELEQEYAEQRIRNEQTEAERREEIRRSKERLKPGNP